MSFADLTPAERVEHLIALTEGLEARLKADLEAFEAHRPHEVAATVAETQRLADEYRRSSAQVKADPGLIAAAPLARRRRLVEATRAFDATVQRHQGAVAAARQITDGLIRTIASVVVDSRKPAAGYGPQAFAAKPDARAIALNRKA